MNTVKSWVCAAAAGLVLSGAAMATPGDVVISQAYGGGGNSGSTYKNDFIEIYNRSNAAVSIVGWSVQYASSAGTAWTVTAIGTGGVTMLAPGQYYLIQEAAGTGGTTNLPAPDATGTTAMGGTGFKVALVNSTTALSGAIPTGTGPTIVDFVGCSSGANGFEGSAAAPAPSNTNAVIRGGGGCADTDSNSTDFTAGLATPRNSSTMSSGSTVGSCCDTLGGCVEGIQCGCSGSNVFTAGGTCTPNTCPITQGSCCTSAGNCFLSDGPGCGTGRFTSLGTACAAANCAQYSASCCSNTDGTCFVSFPASCGAGNIPGTLGTTCTPNNCFQPSGACCSGNLAGSTCQVMAANACSTLGFWLGADSACTAGICAPPAVAISQFYGAGGNAGAVYQQDYAELFNRSASTVDLSGWTIQYASSAGTSWQRTSTFPNGATIAPGHYFLVLLTDTGTVGADLTGSADFVPGNSIDTSGTTGKVALVRTGSLLSAVACHTGEAVLVDFLGYGSGASCFEGANPAPGLSAATAEFRAAHGCQDNNDNSTDFAAAAPSPRNSLNSFDCNAPTVAVTLSPVAICNGTSSTLTATLTAGANPPSSSYTVTADLTNIGGGSAVAFSGTFPTFTLSATPSGAVTQGSHSIVVTVTDQLNRSATATVNLFTSPCMNSTSTVVISQVYGGGGNTGSTYTNDFVELFNRSGASVDLTGWSVQYASATDSGGGFTAGNVTPLNGSIAAGGYYLVRMAAGTNSGTALPTPDAIGTTNMGATSGRVALTSSTTAIGATCNDASVKDLVGYGVGAACFEGDMVIGPVGDLDNPFAAIRRQGGCQDTDQNKLDFDIAAPTPRNSSSPANPCTPVASGVCCRGATCNSTVAQGSCTGNTLAGAVFVATASTCNAGGSSTTPCCYPDYNKISGVTVGDIFDFLNDWFSGSPYANFAGDGTPVQLAVQNIFDFLNAWFAGGC